MSATYTAVLEASEDTVLFLSTLLHAERGRRGTRRSTRALGTNKQAVLVLRWFLEDARMSALVRDNAIAVSTAYAYRDEGIAVLAVGRPSLRGALLAAKAAGHSHVIVDGTLTTLTNNGRSHTPQRATRKASVRGRTAVATRRLASSRWHFRTFGLPSP
ncbi:hypothetical protein LX90_008924 [Lentzea flava]|nr:hypothetical protein [Lentzea flava]